MTPLETLCVERGVRLTEHRRIVLEVLEAAIDHPCAQEIHRRAACNHRIGMATVYRTLNSLSAAGLVTRHLFRDGKARYERAGRPSHPHLIDVNTGTIVEVDEVGLVALMEEAAREMGYRLVDYRLTLFGARRTN